MCNAPFVRGIKRKTMKKATLLLALAGSMAALPCMAQDGYTISGKVRDQTINKIRLMIRKTNWTTTSALAKRITRLSLFPNCLYITNIKIHLTNKIANI